MKWKPLSRALIKLFWEKRPTVSQSIIPLADRPPCVVSSNKKKKQWLLIVAIGSRHLRHVRPLEHFSRIKLMMLLTKNRVKWYQVDRKDTTSEEMVALWTRLTLDVKKSVQFTTPFLLEISCRSYSMWARKYRTKMDKNLRCYSTKPPLDNESCYFVFCFACIRICYGSLKRVMTNMLIFIFLILNNIYLQFNSYIASLIG